MGHSFISCRMASSSTMCCRAGLFSVVTVHVSGTFTWMPELLTWPGGPSITAELSCSCSLGTAVRFRKFLFCLSSEKRSLQTRSCKCPRLQATAVQQCSNVTRWKLNDVTGHVIVCTARKNTLTHHRFISKSTAAEAECGIQSAAHVLWRMYTEVLRLTECSATLKSRLTANEAG